MSLTLRHAARAALVVALGASIPGCIFGSPGPSNVAEGQQYTAGDPTYDQFFSELFLVQLELGRAPDRAAALRERLAHASGVPAESGTTELALGVSSKAAKLGASGASLKLSTSGLDGAGAVTAKLVTTGTPANPTEVAFITDVDKSIEEAAALATDMRNAKPSIEHIENEPAALEPGVDETFHKGGAPKKAEVRKNLEDAGKLIPLMKQRASEIEKDQVDLLKKLEQSLGAAPAPAAEPAPPPTVAVGEPPKKKPKAHPTTSAAPASDAPAPAPAPASSPPKPKPKPAAPPPSEDFEP